jgi:hypothetical protein
MSSPTHQVQSILARLLASENIAIHHGNYSTAFFDVKTRTLGLPNWKLDDKDAYDLLIGHEVGHALYTPVDAMARVVDRFPKCPQGVVNIVEDVRIERLMQVKFPGLISSFRGGYLAFLRDDIFGLSKVNAEGIAKMQFVDRMNLHAKIGTMVNIPLDDEERALYDECFAAETFDDVIEVCGKICAFVKARRKAEKAKEKEAAKAATPPPPAPPMPESPPEEPKGETPAEPELEPEDETPEEPEDETPEEPKMEVQHSAHVPDDDDGEGEAAKEGEPTDDAKGEPTDDAKGEPSDDAKGEPSDEAEPSDDSDSDDDEPSKGSQGSEGANVTDPSDEADEDEDIEAPVTDSTFSENLKGLAQLNGPASFIASTTTKCMAQVIPYEKVMASRHAKRNYGEFLSNDFKNTAFRTFKDGIKPTIQALSSGFERRKAAYQYSRATVSTRGVIDVNRLHSYRYDDAIFKSVTKLANAKAHGMVFLIDYSGSMSGVLSQVVNQTIQLTMFAKSVGIPFEVYGFTNVNSSTLEENISRQARRREVRHDEIDLTNTQVFELLSSKMPPKVYDLAVRELRDVASSYSSDICSSYESLSGTPLNEALIIMHDVIKRFRDTHKPQKMIFMVLSDGAGCQMSAGSNTDAFEDQFGMRPPTGIPNGRSAKIRIHGRDVDLGIRTNVGKTAALIENIKITQGCTTIGFFIKEGRSGSKRVSFNAHDVLPDVRTALIVGGVTKGKEKVIEACGKEYAANGYCEFANGNGYDSYMFVSSRLFSFSDTKATSAFDGLDVIADARSTAQISKLANSFTSVKSTKRKQQLFVDRFINLLA